MTDPIDLKVTISREHRGNVCQFVDLFEGFDEVQAVRELFGEDARRVLEDTKIHLVRSKGYLRVDNDTGDIIICRPYLKSGEERHFYLDLIHELVHVRQHQEGKELYDRTFAYVDRPTEVEAYEVAVTEARRIGMTEEEIVDYLRVEWVSEVDFKRMLKTLGVAQAKSKTKKP